MSRLLDALWRAGAYCLHPQVVLWSLLPLALAGALTLGLGWWFWEPAVAAVRAGLERFDLIHLLLAWLESIGGAALRAVIAPLIVVALAVPLVVVLTLLLVTWLMAPAMVRLVAERRFPSLEKRGSGAWTGVLWSIGAALLALLALLLTLPLWLIPPLALLVPALIWGWLAAKVFGFDALAQHADAAERRHILHAQRWPLLAMGIAVGLLGAAPSLMWLLSAAALVFAPLLLLLSVWLYTLFFAFAALWFAHFALAHLARLRADARTHAALPSSP
jgi:hypothetical protein